MLRGATSLTGAGNNRLNACYVANNHPSKGGIGKETEKSAVIPPALPILRFAHMHGKQSDVFQQQTYENKGKKEIVAKSLKRFAIQQRLKSAGAAASRAGDAGVTAEPTSR